MDFHLDDDQQALQETVSQFCRSRWPIEALAERSADSFDRSAWDDYVALGLPGLLASEAKGGLALGCVEGAIAFEQLGRHLVPGPLLWSALAALLVPDVARGHVIATGIDGRSAGPHLVEHLERAELVLVLHDGARATVVERAAMDATPSEEPFDPHTPIAVVEKLPSGRAVGSPSEITQLLQVGQLLAASLQLGIAQASLDVAVAYAQQREQFGVPIGSFQALKHIMADMYVRIGLARSSTYAAAATLDDPEIGHLGRSLAGAKLLAGEAAVENAKAAVQILGGMGFTWEMPPHFLLKRGIALDYAFGTPRDQALAISDSLAEESR